MTLITVSQGGPPPDQDIADGVYQVYLEKIDGPKIIVPKFGDNAGKEVSIFEWLFVIEGGDYDGRDLQANSSTASGPRSKMYSWLTALLGGKPPAVGQQFGAQDLVGLRALATVSHSESMWPKLENLGAMPSSMRPAAPATAVVAPAPAPAPVAAAPTAAAAPARRTPPPPPGAAVAPVAAADDALPF